MNKIGTVALAVLDQGNGPEFLEAFSNDDEIRLLESTLKEGRHNPLARIHQLRKTEELKDEEFGDYVEDLLCQPFVSPEIQEHGVQWLRSKIKIEEYQRYEEEATRVIAEYAYRIYRENPGNTDFMLAGPRAQVRIRIFEVPARLLGSSEQAA